jgi:Uma2 family endonuclease
MTVRAASARVAGMLDPAQLAPETVRPLLRREYEAMVALGLFEDERVELIEGTLVTMSPQGSAHAEVLTRLTRELLPRLLTRALVRVQSPLALGDRSEPEPDLALVPLGDYAAGHPSAAYLVVEVADSSLAKDAGVKAALYARAGIPEYWIVDLAARELIVHHGPRGAAWASVARLGAEASVAPEAFADVALSVGAIIPAPHA